MKVLIISLVLIAAFPVLLPAAQLTLNRDADLLDEDGDKVMTIKAGEVFKFEQISGKWVYGAYYYDAGVAKGVIASDAFKEQKFLKMKSAALAREMKNNDMVMYNGEWIPREEKERLENEAKGLVLYEDQWMTPEERDNIIAQKEAESETGEDPVLVENPFDVEPGEGDVNATSGSDDSGGENPDVEDDSSSSVDENPFAVEPGIEDQSDPPADNGDAVEIVEPSNDNGEPSKQNEKKGIDWDKTTKPPKEKPKDGVETFTKVFFPGIIGLGLVMVLIFVLSGRKGSKG